MPIIINKSGSGSIGIVQVGSGSENQPPDVEITRARTTVVTLDTEGLSFDWTEIVTGFVDSDILTEDILIEGTGRSDIIDFDFTDPSAQAIANLQVPVDSRGSVIITVIKDAATDLDPDVPLSGPVQPRSITVPFNTRRPRVTLSSQFHVDLAGVNVQLAWDQDVDFSTAPTATWNDTQMKTGTAGNLTETTPNRTWAIDYEFPQNSTGRLDLELPPDTAIAVAVPNRQGDPETKTLSIEYNTREGLEQPQPATVQISIPGQDPYTQGQYTSDILWSHQVNGFTDIDVLVTSSAGTVTKGKIEQDTNNHRLWRLPITMIGRGQVTIRIPKESVSAAGVPSPVEDAEAVFNFDVANLQLTTTPAGTTRCSQTYTFDANPVLNSVVGHDRRDNAGGGFLGQSDMIIDQANNTGYVIVQVQKWRRAGELSGARQAGAALMWFSLESNDCGVVKAYPSIVQAPRSPVIHDGKVLYFEGSHYIYNFPPNLPSELVEDEIGYTIEVTRTGVTRQTLTWRSQFPSSQDDRFFGVHGGTKSPLVTAGESLFALTGHARTDFAISRQAEAGESQSTEANATDYRNWQFVSWSKEWNQRITQLDTNNQTGWTVLENLAKLTNSFIGFDNGRFVFKSNEPTTAALHPYGIIPGSAPLPDLVLYKQNRQFAITGGFLAIGNEILSYERCNDPGSGNAISVYNIQRAQNGTVEQRHDADARVVYVNHILNANHLANPINTLNKELDYSNLFNKVICQYASGDPRLRHQNQETITLTDDTSISQHGERVLNLELDLSIHQGIIAGRLALAYLNRFSTLQYLIRIEIKPAFHFKLGEVIAIREPINRDINRVGRIVAIGQNYQSKTTSLTIRSLAI